MSLIWSKILQWIMRFWGDFVRILMAFWRGLRGFWRDFERIFKGFWGDFEGIWGVFKGFRGLKVPCYLSRFARVFRVKCPEFVPDLIQKTSKLSLCARLLKTEKLSCFSLGDIKKTSVSIHKKLSCFSLAQSKTSSYLQCSNINYKKKLKTRL